MSFRSSLLVALLVIPAVASAQGLDYDGTFVVEATRTGKPLTAHFADTVSPLSIPLKEA